MPCDHYTEQKRVGSSWSAGQSLLCIQQFYVINKSLTLDFMSSNPLFQLISPDCNSLNYYWLYTVTLWYLSIPTTNSNIGSTSDVGSGSRTVYLSEEGAINIYWDIFFFYKPRFFKSVELVHKLHRIKHLLFELIWLLLYITYTYISY